MSNETATASKYLATPNDVIILIIDYQEKLLPHVHGHEAILRKACKLVRFSQMLSLPTVATEQYPKGLGPTVPRITKLLDKNVPIICKHTFSCMRDTAFLDRLRRFGRSCAVVSGIETHICVGQTVCDLLAQSFSVHVLSDCVGSRSQHDHEVGLRKMRDAGAVISTLEAFMYEILTSSQHPMFKRFLAQIVK